MILSIILWFYKVSLRTFPAGFRAEFAEEMAVVFQEHLTQQARRGTWALLVMGGHELQQLPLALWRVHLAAWRKKQVVQTCWHFLSQSPFHPLPPANDGRFSWRQTILELMPFVVTAVCLFLLTYNRPEWVPAAWQRQWSGLGWFTALFALPIFVLGVARGLPRWAYPAGGLLLGYSLLLAQWTRLTAFWVGLLLAAFVLGLAAMYTHLHSQPLPPFLQRLSQSMALDWTRLAFGLYGLMPYLLIAAFDGVYRTDGTPYMALSLLLLILGALAYSRCRQQPRQFAILATAVSAALLPPLLHQAAFQGAGRYWLADLSWLAPLWAFMMTLLLLPLLSRLIYQTWAAISVTSTDGEPL